MTSRAAEQVQFDVYRTMTPAEKIDRVRALCRRANSLTLAGLWHRRPEETENQLRARLAAMRLGDALTRALAAARSRG